MHSDSTIQKLWVRRLGEVGQPGETKVKKVEDGYYLVVRAPEEDGNSDSTSASDDYSALGSQIPNLCRTRAVYLNLGGSDDLRDVPNPRVWLGEAADGLESGDFHAFAVVDTAIFSRRIAWELLTRGWRLEETGQDLEVRDGRFKAPVNLPRAVVRMVLSPTNMEEAARTIVRELSAEFLRDAGFFVRFQKRFEMFQPDVLDHYFVAYSEASCVALAWDYWHLGGRPTNEAEEIFNQGLEEFEQLLQSPMGTWLPGVSSAVCAPDSYKN